MKRVLIAGANRGLGLEFARQYTLDGWDVVATARRPEEATELRRLGARIERLDTRDAASLDALAQSLAGESLDVLLCNAGIHGPRADRLADLPNEDFDLVMRTNVLGPLRMALAFADHVATAHGAMVFMSSKMGSIEAMNSTTSIAYRMSKAALNTVVKASALELGRRGIRVLALHAGWVRTDMGGSAATLSAPESVSGMRGIIDRATELHGGFFDYSGERIPW